MITLLTKCFVLTAMLNAPAAVDVSMSEARHGEIDAHWATQPQEPSKKTGLTLIWDGPGGVILLLNDAEYVAQKGSKHNIIVPMNKALKVCIKKPFETLCAEYYLIVSEENGQLKVSEKDGRAHFDFSADPVQKTDTGQSG